MAYDPAVAAVIQSRLDIVKTLDGSAALSFLESARFRLELVDVAQRAADGAISSSAANAELGALKSRIDAVIARAQSAAVPIVGGAVSVPAGSVAPVSPPTVLGASAVPSVPPAAV